MSLSIIPENKQEAVATALQSAFGVDTVVGCEPVAGGMSTALVYKITLNSASYLLRLGNPANHIGDPARSYTCMQTAADAGIAPQVFYADPVAGVMITAFIDQRPLRKEGIFPGGLFAELARTIRSIHALPGFPEVVNYLDAVDWFIGQFKLSQLLPESATEEYFHLYSQIQRSYPRYDPDRVASHNDLNPKNILYDGIRLWVIDWDSAMANDRYADLANVANFFVADETGEETLLQTYFGSALDAYKRARFFLMRQVCYMKYAMIFMKMASATLLGDSQSDPRMNTPTLPEIYALIGTGEFSLSTHEGLLLFGKVLLNESLRLMKTPRFDQSLREMA